MPAHAAVAREREDPKRKELILQQLERLLAHPVFRTSKRCHIFLRHVVERTVRGETDQSVKERSIGVEVFGRETGYDTNHDPIVRTTAGEVRKRIAQYYHEPGHEIEIRIELPPGSYVPEFFFPADVPDTLAATPKLEEVVVPPAKSAAPHRPGWQAAKWGGASLALILPLLFLAGGIGRSRLSPSPTVLDQFWSPVLNSSAPILVSIGLPGTDVLPTRVPSPVQSMMEYIRNSDHIALSDGIALADIAALLGKKGTKCRVQSSSGTSLTDLRQGPAILIAAFDNPWTLRAVDRLRFHFVHTSTAPNIFSIQDRENPAREWSVNWDMPYSKVTQDFAIIARLVDPVSDQTEVVAAGIGENGTIGAGEFLTNERFLEQIAAHAPKDWAHKNVEAVIATQVIDEKSGPPRLLAVQFW